MGMARTGKGDSLVKAAEACIGYHERKAHKHRPGEEHFDKYKNLKGPEKDKWAKRKKQRTANQEAQTPVQEPTFYDRGNVRFDHLSHGEGYGFERREVLAIDAQDMPELTRLSDAAKNSQKTLHYSIRLGERSLFVEARPDGVIGLPRLKWETFGRSMTADKNSGREIYGRTSTGVQIFNFNQWDGNVPQPIYPSNPQHDDLEGRSVGDRLSTSETAYQRFRRDFEQIGRSDQRERIF